MKKLSLLKQGESGRIVEISVAGPIKTRLMDMGVLVGEVVRVTKKAPLGGPIAVIVKDYCLSFRKKDANRIAVEEIH
jgi:Fe2+ transport system protein FeoA